METNYLLNMLDGKLNLEPNSLQGIFKLKPEDLEKIIELNGLSELRDKYLNLRKSEDSGEFDYVDKLLNFKETDYPQLFENVEVSGMSIPKVLIFGLLNSYQALKRAYIIQASISSDGIKKPLSELTIKDFIQPQFFSEFEATLSEYFTQLPKFIAEQIIQLIESFNNSFDKGQISQENLREKYSKLVAQQERLLQLFKLDTRIITDLEENMGYMKYRVDKKAEEIKVSEKPKPSHVISVGNETLDIDSNLETVLETFKLSGKNRKQIKILFETVFNYLAVAKKQKDHTAAFNQLFNTIPEANWLIKSKLTEGNGFKLSGTVIPNISLIVSFSRADDQIVVNFSTDGINREG